MVGLASSRRQRSSDRSTTLVDDYTLIVYKITMKQISVQITDETARQIADLAVRWGLPKQRHNTSVIERTVATIYMLEIGYDDYRQRYEAVTQEEAQ